MFDLTGMNALVTGGSGGIGSAIARSLAQQGARVAVSGSNADKLRAFRDELDEHTPQHLQQVDHVAIACDLSKAEEVEKLVPAAVDTLGGLDILINNAGITRDNLALRMKDEEWDAVIRINLEAAFRLMRAAARPMMKARFGRIITITSVVGATGNPGQMNYAAAKGGLTAMSKSLAQELATPRHHRELRCSRLHPHGDDRSACRRAEDSTQRPDPDGPDGRGRGHRRGLRLPCQPRGGLCHRADAAR